MTKNSSFLHYGCFHELLLIVLEFEGDLHVFRVMTKDLSFLHFMALFISYCPWFWGFTAMYMFERYEPKLFVFAFYGRFHELLPTVLGFYGDLHV